MILVMEKSEPALVPEWLKNSGSITGGGTTNHQFAHSDDPVVSKSPRNRSAVNVGDHDLGRTTSSYFRRSSSSNGSPQSRLYSSFGRNHRDRDWDRDGEKSVLGDHRRRDCSDPLVHLLPSRLENDGLRRSLSMVAGKRGETVPTKFGAESNNANKNIQRNGSGLLVGGTALGSVHKVALDKDFPSFGTDGRRGNREIGRVPSPGLSSAIQNLSVGNSGVTGGDGWTSALAEVPVLVGSNVTSASIQQVLPVTSAAANMNTGLNMAEALAQGPTRTPTNPQLSVETQRLEELAIKQCRQLIPVTPSMPKALALNPPDKAKSKVGQQQISSSHVNTSPRGGPVKPDVSKSSTLGKLQVLKPGRERNGVSLALKDSLSPTSASKISNSALATASSVVGPAPLRGPGNSLVLASTERKPVLVTLEKRPTPQSQSRNDFFNLMRKKSLANSPSAVLGSGPAVSPSDLDKSTERECTATTHGGDATVLDTSGRDHSTENGVELDANGDAINMSKGTLDNGKNHSVSDTILSSEEEEAFLRSLGWEENEGEDDGLTEEEINAFYRDVSKYINSRSSSKIFQGMQPKKLLLPLKLHIDGIGGVSSGLSSSDSKLES